MDLPPRPATPDVLAQPTRAEIFRLVTELRRPVGTDELAKRLGLHPNGVRAHLDRLREAGLVERERPHRPRGRPRDMWTVAPGAQPGGDRPTAYGDLGRWLARIVPGDQTGLALIEAGGREIGRELAPAGNGEDPRERMRATLAAMGFAPTCRRDGGGALTYELCNCPYRDAVLENREAVCTLHRGITRGLIDVLSPDSRLDAFVAKDPVSAGCLIGLSGPMAEETVAS